MTGGLMLMGGCLSLSQELELQEARVARGDLDAAYRTAAEAAETSNADTTFWQAEAGTLALMAEQPREAVTHLNAADEGFNDLARRVYGAEAANWAGAVAVNDCVMPYGPEGVDRVFANLYKALAYGALGKPGALRVELNRARQRQYEWFYACARAIAERSSVELNAAERAAVKASTAEALAKQGGAAEALAAKVAIEAANARSPKVAAYQGLQGFGNAYAAHLAGVTRWCAGDAPLGDLAMAAALAPEHAVVQSDFAAEGQGAPRGRVWVYIEDGLAPKRVSNPFVIPYPSIAGRQGIGTLSFDMPSLQVRPAAAHYTVEGQAPALLQDVEALVQDQFDRAYPGILTRQITRTLLRVLTTEAAHAGMEHQQHGVLWVVLLDIVMAAYDIATNSADVRCADLLPKRVWMTSVPTPQDGLLEIVVQGARTERLELAVPRGGNAVVWVRKPTAAGKLSTLVIPLEPAKGVTP